MASPDISAKRIARYLIMRGTTTPSDVDLYLRYHMSQRHTDLAFAQNQRGQLFSEVCALLGSAVVRTEWPDDDLTLADEIFEALGGGGMIGTATAASQAAEYVKVRLQKAEAATAYARQCLEAIGQRLANPPANTMVGLNLKYVRPMAEDQAILRMVENALVGMQRVTEDD